MEIFVEGVSSKFVQPDQIIVNIFFKTSAKTYNEALSKGLNNVETFNNLVLLENNIKKEDLQTRSFSINEERIYNEITRKNEIKGYTFNQFAILKLDYDNELLSRILLLTSSLESQPDINLQFGLKDESKYLEELINSAYKDANMKANMMAKSANKKLKDIIIMDLNGVSNIRTEISESSFDATVFKTMNINNIDTSAIHPEDIEVTIKIITKWNTV